MSEWTPERIEQLVARWESGASASIVAQELGGVTRNAVLGKLFRLGYSNTRGNPVERVSRPRQPRIVKERAPRVPKYNYAAIATAWAAGVSREDMVQQFGCSYATIRLVRKAAGLPSRKLPGKQRRLMEEQKGSIIARWLAFEDSRDIARSLGIKRNSLTWYLHMWRVRKRGVSMADAQKTVQYLKAATEEQKVVLREKGPQEFLRVFRADRQREEKSFEAAAELATQADLQRRAQIAKNTVAKVAAGQDRREAILEGRRLGATLKDLGDAFGITRERIRQIEAGRKPSTTGRPRGPKRRFDYELIAERYRSGVATPAIADEFHCSTQTVWKAVGALRIPRRTRHNKRRLDYSAIKTAHAAISEAAA